MKIRIPAQTRRNITNEAFERDVIENSQVGNMKNFSESDNLIGVIKYESGEKKVYQILPINVDNVKYISALANPTHLFLSTAIEMYQLAKKRRLENFPKCGKKLKNANMFVLDFKAGYTHECYNDFLKARITSIIMLVSALESFMNQVIPDNFECSVISNGKAILFKNKKEIESPKAYFKIKIEQIIPKLINQEEFWKTRKDDLKVLHELYEQRITFIHLKTQTEEEWKRYSDVFAKMVKFDLSNAINSAIKFMNSIERDFIEIDKMVTH